MEPRKDAQKSSNATKNGEEHPFIMNSSSAAADDDDDNQRNHNKENPHIPLLASMRKKLHELAPLSSDRCIYRVPEQLRVKNPSAYTPRVVSVGPIHHGREGLEIMEEYKQRYLAEFLQRTQVSLEDYVTFVKEREEKLRSCYADTIQLTSDKLVEIVMVDAAFIVLLLLKFAEDDLQECCRIYNRPFYIMNIMVDMLLLENQLPLFILEDLFNFAKIKIKDAGRGGGGGGEFSFVKLLCMFINYRSDIRVKDYDLKKVENCKQLKHFLDCLRFCHLLSSREDSPSPVQLEMEEDSVQYIDVPTASKLHQAEEESVQYIDIPNVTELNLAEVKITKSPSTHLLDIKFEDKVLLIPRMYMGHSTETIYRNLLAFEQCHYLDHSRLFTDYFVLMGRLIKTRRDVDLLVKFGIIENALGDNAEVASIFKALASDLVMKDDEFYFAHFCKELRAFSRVPWHKWMVLLKREYFNDPWAFITILVAAFTFMQTALAVLSIYLEVKQ